jgi:hypothetical protein
MAVRAIVALLLSGCLPSFDRVDCFHDSQCESGMVCSIELVCVPAPDAALDAGELEDASATEDASEMDTGVFEDASICPAPVDAGPRDAMALDGAPPRFLECEPRAGSECRAMCTATWCWDSPLPQGGPVTGMWAASENDVWAAVESGMLHYDGNEWSCGPSPTDVIAVHGRASNDVWVSGYGMAAHYDGTEWVSVAVGSDLNPYWGVWPTPTDQVWAVGGDHFAHYDGSTWTITEEFNATFFRDVYGFADDDVYAVGSGGSIAHYDGAWSIVRTGAGYLDGVWGACGEDVWAGGNGLARRLDSQWNDVTGLGDDPAIAEIWGSSPNDVWFSTYFDGLVHFDGEILDMRGFVFPPYYAITGSGPRDVWFGGAFGRMLHYDGLGFVDFGCGVLGNWNSVWGSSATDIWAVGEGGRLAHSNGGEWRLSTGIVVGSIDIFGVAANDIYTVGPNTVVQYDGQWSALPGVPSGMWSDIWASGGEIWIAEPAGRVAHFDGGQWNITTFPQPVADVFGTATNDVWAVGAEGSIAHFDGADWLGGSAPTSNDIAAVWASSATVAFAATAGGILAWDGLDWSNTTETGSFVSVSGSGPNDVWAAGPTILSHWDGRTWTRTSSEEIPFSLAAGNYTLRAIHAPAPGAVWGVGNGVIVRRR